MKRFIKTAVVSGCFWLAGACSATPVIFDTDVAIDDWSALLLLANHPDVELLAVTANGVGETHCQPALRNIPALLDLTKAAEVSFGCGDDYPMDGFFVFPDPWREQADTLSGVAVPASDRIASEAHAVEIIHQSLAKSSQPVTLIATGSLTNIAQWLAKYPDDKSKVSRLVIMGGAFKVHGNIVVPGFTDGHPNNQAEWNIYVDPLAASQVFASGLAIEVVGLDVTNQVQVTQAFAKEFKQKASTPAADFWDMVLDDNDWFIDSGEYYFWDVLAALVVIDPAFCEGEMQPVWVEYQVADQPSAWDAKHIPALRADGSKRNHLDPAKSGITHLGGDNPPVKICTSTLPERAFSLFTQTLNHRF
ncbi:nucleoside hydrolase [Halioxenophilus sp. WMMB6]|uniref:nucleoside hydrolase n=1 Tax=Halioxenophilus sp. WMMB6 TaxID=3073815 RepID=UPI00295E9C50|nr:nucleoside hydrolase [Halioxenophilus sp. WMMB6]